MERKLNILSFCNTFKLFQRKQSITKSVPLLCRALEALKLIQADSC